MTGGRGSTQNDREEGCQEEVEGAKKGKSDGEYLLVIVSILWRTMVSRRAVKPGLP